MTIKKLALLTKCNSASLFPTKKKDKRTRLFWRKMPKIVDLFAEKKELSDPKNRCNVVRKVSFFLGADVPEIYRPNPNDENDERWYNLLCAYSGFKTCDDESQKESFKIGDRYLVSGFHSTVAHVANYAQSLTHSIFRQGFDDECDTGDAALFHKLATALVDKLAPNAPFPECNYHTSSGLYFLVWSLGNDRWLCLVTKKLLL